MRAIMIDSVTHGFLTFGVFVGLSVWSSSMELGFAAAILLSALASWFRPCHQPFVLGALLGLMLAGLISFVFVDGSAPIIALPLMAIVMATAVLLGFVIGRLLRRLFAQK